MLLSYLQEEKEELDEILAKRKKNSKKQVDEKLVEEKTTLHSKFSLYDQSIVFCNMT